MFTYLPLDALGLRCCSLRCVRRLVALASLVEPGLRELGLRASTVALPGFEHSLSRYGTPA